MLGSNLSTRHLATVVALSIALLPALASEGREPTSPKEAAHARMVAIQDELESAASSGRAHPAKFLLAEEYARLSDSLGGDAPGATRRATAAEPAQIAALAVAPACGFATTTGSFNGTTGSLGSGAPGVTNFSVLVSGVGTYLWDVDLHTQLAHPDNSQIDMTLTSPLGTVVVITSDNGGTLDNGFNGTLWDDGANDPVTEKTFTNLVAATPLSPEGRLEAFRGENPNGTWTLRVEDDTNLLLGTLTDWSLDIQTLPSAPVPSTTVYTASPNNPIRDGGSLVGSHVAAGLGTYLSRATVYVEIPHQNSSDLDLSLQGPTGLPVKLTTDNGAAFDNVYNGTLFDGDSTDTVTDHAYVNLVAATPLAPESGLEYFRGTNPNGVWTLIVTDDTTSLVGTFKRWDLALTTIPAPSPSGPVSFSGPGGPLADATPAVTSGTWMFTANVSGMQSYLWDLDLTTAITHTFAGDLDITLQSPAGSVVVVTTDNGAGNDDVYNGTLWDEQANFPVTDYVFTNAVAATPLAPEGRFSAFRGENPNGTWTMKIVDDAGADSGNLASWKLDVATIPGAPTVMSNTYTQSPNLAIADLSTVMDTISVAGAGSSIAEVELYVEILHSECADLDITLTSPQGTIVTVCTDNGGANDNILNGTLFDPGLVGALAPIGDVAYVNNMAVTSAVPEGPFDAFLGQNPNGNWTLTVADDLATDVGTLVRWDLTIRNCGAPPSAAYCFGDGTGTACPCTPVPLVGDPDKGCPNSFNAGGGKLTSSGNPSIGADTLVMTCTLINNGGAVVFQGTNDNGGGLGTAFGDGLRCAAGTVRRMRSHAVSTNSYQYPDPMQADNAISIRGAVLAPGDRWYQGWYRSGLAHCNPAQNYNLTNGLKITWVP